MCDSEVQNQRHQTLRLREVDIQINVPTSLTPTPSHLLRFYVVGCAKEVSNLINHPVVNLLDTLVGGTSAEKAPKTSCNRKSREVFPEGTGSGLPRRW